MSPDSWSETDLGLGMGDDELTSKCRSWRTMVITRYTRGEKPELKCRFGCVGGVYGKNGPRIRNFHGRLWGICLAYMVLGPILTSLSFRRRGGSKFLQSCRASQELHSALAPSLWWWLWKFSLFENFFDIAEIFQKSIFRNFLQSCRGSQELHNALAPSVWRWFLDFFPLWKFFGHGRNFWKFWKK